MRGAVLYAPRDVRFEEREAPKIRVDRCHPPDLAHVRMRVGPVAESRTFSAPAAMLKPYGTCPQVRMPAGFRFVALTTIPSANTGNQGRAINDVVSLCK